MMQLLLYIDAIRFSKLILRHMMAIMIYFNNVYKIQSIVGIICIGNRMGPSKLRFNFTRVFKISQLVKL
jgi:hypothetical protein